MVLYFIVFIIDVVVAVVIIIIVMVMFYFHVSASIPFNSTHSADREIKRNASCTGCFSLTFQESSVQKKDIRLRF